MAVWLLDLDIGGVVYRFATESTTVTRNDGTTVQYQAGLGSLALGSAGQGRERNESIEVGSSVDWFEIEARGMSLNRQPAVVRFWQDGDVFETARVYLRGTTSNARHGNTGEPLTFSIRSNLADDAFSFPLPQAVVEDETWPVTVGSAIVERNEGKPYPVVIGVPGHHPRGGATYVPSKGAPSVWAEYEYSPPTTTGFRVVADGRIHASTVRMYDAAGFNTGVDAAITETVDALGRLVSGFDGGPLAEADVEKEWWVGFGDNSGYGGGRMNPYGPGYLRGAGDVIRWVLEECTTLDIDLPAIVGAANWLNRWKVDAVINDTVNMLEWLESEVLAHMPVIRVEGPRGIYYAPLKWDATDADVQAHLLPGMVSRTSPVTQYDDEIRNSLSIQYRPVRDGSQWGSRRVLGAEYGRNGYIGATLGLSSLPWNSNTQTDVRYFADPLCRFSYAQHGAQEWTGTNHSCWDDASIALSLDYMAMRYATPKRFARYTGPFAKLEGIEPGAVVRLTDDEIYASSVIALVVERITTTTVVHLDIVILDDPYKTSRRVI